MATAKVARAALNNGKMQVSDFPAQQQKMIRRYLSIALIVLFIAAIAVFTWQNIELVTVSFFTVHLTLPLALLVVLIYALGMFTGGMLWSLLRRVARKASPQCAAARLPCFAALLASQHWLKSGLRFP
jgi:uncharacterized integral membrane protein